MWVRGESYVNGVDYVVNGLIYLTYSEANDSISIRNQPRISPIVTFELVRIAIDFDHKPRGLAKEIGEVRADRNLPSKLEPADLPIAKPQPHIPLDLGHVVSELARAYDFW